jgi:hypothetical protein
MSEPLLNTRFTQTQRKIVCGLMPTLADRLKLDEKTSRTISFTPEELQSIQQNAAAAPSRAETGMEGNSLRHVVDAISKAIEDSEGIGSISASERLYQFKITLLESKPPIRRRIRVKICMLDTLNEHIQTAMGWTNSHLYQFEIDGEPDLIDDGLRRDPFAHSALHDVATQSAVYCGNPEAESSWCWSAQNNLGMAIRAG